MPKSVYTSKYQFSDDELALQRSRSRYLKDMLLNVCEDFKPQEDGKAGIFLSGGVDSTTILWAMLNRGMRPYVYTFKLPTTEHLSKDAFKAKTLAERYDLPFRIIEFPDDPNWLARRVESVYHGEVTEIDNRADFEVCTLWDYMLEQAAEMDGITHLFSGIADGNINLLSRKIEIRARQNLMSQAEQDYRRLDSANANQTYELVNLAQKHGIELVLPLAITANTASYYKVPWHVVNIPRLKAIMMDAWLEEEEDSGIKAVVSPMQCGDTGSREYFDSLLSKSSYAAELSGRTITSAIPYYNDLKRIRHGGKPESDENYPMPYEWLGYVTENRPIIKGSGATITLKDPNDDNRGIDPRELFTNEVDEDDIFAVSEPEIPDFILDDNGNPDTRLDCFGNEFWQGDSVTYTKCPRARAGFCGKYHDNPPFEMDQCEMWGVFKNRCVTFLERISEMTTGQTSQVYHQWADNAEEIFEKISSKTFSFDVVSANR